MTPFFWIYSSATGSEFSQFGIMGNVETLRATSLQWGIPLPFHKPFRRHAVVHPDAGEIQAGGQTGNVDGVCLRRDGVRHVSTIYRTTTFSVRS